ncbi:MAG TPA: DHH family phosphoesterase, partial [Armatimonadota bacterium]
MSAASLPPPEPAAAPQKAPAKRRVSLARLRRALELLDSHSTFLITSHISPDGDAIGSALALRHLLADRGKQAQVVLQDPVPAEYVGLPGADQIAQTPPDIPAEVAIVVDCENLGRVGALGPAVERCGDLLVLDHHLSSGRFGRLELRETASAACAELLYRLVRLADGLTPEIAECLMAGLVLDTGGFRFPNVTPTTLRVAAKLVETGAQIPRLYQSIYENRSFSATKLLGLALASTRSALEGNVTYAVL